MVVIICAIPWKVPSLGAMGVLPIKLGDIGHGPFRYQRVLTLRKRDPYFVVVLQFLQVLFTGKVNVYLLQFGKSLSVYQYQIMLFLTYNSETQPFPMDNWPENSSEHSSEHSQESSAENSHEDNPLNK